MNYILWFNNLSLIGLARKRVRPTAQFLKTQRLAQLDAQLRAHMCAMETMAVSSPTV